MVVLNLAKFSNNEITLCDKNNIKKKLFEALKSMYNNKSARNVGLPKEFYKTSWDGLEEPSLNSIRTSLIK